MTQQLKNYPLLVLVLLPILLLLIDSGWIFAPIGHTDTWLYFGYFVNFPQHLRLFAQTYYSARLSWILLGAAAYNQFSPLVANYVLHLGVYYLAIFPFYFTLKLNFSAKIALVTSILFGTHTLFLRAIGWNYTDGVGLAYVLLTIWMLTCSTKLNRKVIYLFLAGAAFACLIYSNPMWISTTPLLFGYFLFQIYQLRGKRRNRPLSQFIAFGGGVAVVTIAFGMIAFQINGNYLFFLPALQASGALAVGTNQWIVSWTYWLPRAAWLVFPAILLLPSLTVLWQNKRTYDQKQLVAAGQIAFPWTFLGLWIIWLFWELTHHPLLQTQYYMDYLLPFGYLAFGAFLAMRWGEWIERHFHTAAWRIIIAFS